MQGFVAFFGVMLAIIGAGTIVTLGIGAGISFVEYLQKTRKLADASVVKCRSLESMLFDISRRADNLARDVHLLKATDKNKESS